MGGSQYRTAGSLFRSVRLYFRRLGGSATTEYSYGIPESSERRPEKYCPHSNYIIPDGYMLIF